MPGLGSIRSLLGLASAGPDAVTLLIDGKRFVGWTSMDLSFSLDGISTINFGAPFLPDSKDFRAVFRPMSFKPLEAYVGSDLVFTGYMITPTPQTGPDASTVSVVGYSLPGVLADCCMPGSAYPLEFSGLDLRQIAERCLKSFDLEVDFAGPWTGALTKVALEADQKVWEFLSGLAKQKGFVLTDTVEGRLLFQRSRSPGNPIAKFRDNDRPATTVSVSFDPQNYHSSVTVIGTKKTGNKGSKWTVGNDHLPDVVRPLAIKLEDTETGDIAEAAKAKLGRMLGNAVTYEVSVPTWRDPSGVLWTPNETVTLFAPGAMVYSETELLIRNVNLKATPSEMTASLGLVLPGSFSGELPSRVPWVGPDVANGGLLDAIRGAL